MNPACRKLYLSAFVSALALTVAQPVLAAGDALQILNQAQAASMAGDYDAAYKNYAKLHDMKPSDDGVLLSLAKVQSWRGNLDDSALLYEDYLSRHGDDGDALLGYAYTQSWRGDYAEALDILERYKASDAMDDGEYRQAKTRFLARSAMSEDALDLANETLQANPFDYQANFSRTVAYKETGRVRQALESLERTKGCCEDRQSTQDLERIVKTPTRHFVRGSVSYATDNDTVDIGAVSLDGRYTINPDLYLRVGAMDGYLRAKRGSGLDTVRGNSTVRDYAGWVGVDYAATDNVWLHAQGGQHDTNVTDAMGIYRLEAEYRPVDELYLDAYVDRDFHAVSPRAVSLDIARTESNVRAVWRPDLRYTVDMNAGYAFFSDDNERWSAGIAPRRSVIRNEDYNLDLGISARWFGFSDELGNGYYDPATYQQYLLTAFSYIKLSDDDGISVIVAPGIHKDENLKNYEFSGNIAVEGTFGLYRDWMLKVRAGAVNNVSINSDTYRRGEVGLSVMRRF